MMDIFKFMDEAFYWIPIGLAIMAIGLLLYKLTGHSPSTLDVILVFQGVTMAALFGMAYRQGKLEEKMDEFNGKFSLLAIDFKVSQGEVRSLQSDFKLMRAEFKMIPADIAEIKRLVGKRRLA